MYKKIVDGLTVLIYGLMFSTLFTSGELSEGFMIGWVLAFIIYSIPIFIVRKVLLIFGSLFEVKHEITNNGK